MTLYADVAPGPECSAFLMSGWEIDGRRMPTQWLVPLVWRRDWPPVQIPKGAWVVGEARE
jgi:hypothetical protein